MSGNSNKFIQETIEPGLVVNYGVKEFMHHTQSEWQSVDVAVLETFGTSLLIDGLIQSAEVDEFVYHESLVHPALLAHSCPKEVFIGGGGEGSTAREVLRHNTVTKCVMVDIDGAVVDFCKKNWKGTEEAYADPRCQLVIDDAKAWLENYEGTFDIIIMDLDDPLEGGPCYQLYTKEFYSFIKSKLNPGGVFVTQSSAAGIKCHTNVFSAVHATTRAVFGAALGYKVPVYSFLDEWGFNMGFCNEADCSPLSAAEVDERIANRLTSPLTFLDGISYTGLFCLSKVHRATLAAETGVLTAENPRFLTNQGLCVADINKKAAE